MQIFSHDPNLLQQVEETVAEVKTEDEKTEEVKTEDTTKVAAAGTNIFPFFYNLNNNFKPNKNVEI